MLHFGRLAGVAIAFSLLVGCAHRSESTSPPLTLEQVALPGPPAGAYARWDNVPVLPGKRRTAYWVEQAERSTGDARYLRARSQSAASALTLRLQPQPAPKQIAWSWKVLHAPEDAATADSTREDSAARIVLMFGPPSNAALDALPMRDQLAMEKARLLLRREPPYATLMYLWSADKSPEAIFISRHTGRVRSVIVDGPRKTVDWQSFDRDVAADFQRAFGEAPGPLIGVAIMTDSDNTGSRAEALYRDLRLR
ncbi:DUF3047 domain-containing protein [Piscinibacterium candidicorallinum]|uniref:DUF3047 domain-containing protein n=1 Tax=Piscinibacterium candidicorallinum TaxID=1793872 RepID=A0ABV7H5E1_9BURK